MRLGAKITLSLMEIDPRNDPGNFLMFNPIYIAFGDRPI